MAYTSFKTLAQIEQKFGIKHETQPLFRDAQPYQVSEWLKQTLAINQTMPTKTEKAKSELIISPVLVELTQINYQKITLFSGEILNADASVGLNGECDFIISKNKKQLEINDPILQIIEAKRQDFELGTSQCAAQMIGAKIFNEKHKNDIPRIYGCVTTGTEWLFLKLDNNLITVDTKRYYLVNLPELLGVFQVIIDEFKPILD
jgi:hypothetical protein